MTFRIPILSLSDLDRVTSELEFDDEEDARDSFALHCEQARKGGGNLRLMRGDETLVSYMAPAGGGRS